MEGGTDRTFGKQQKFFCSCILLHPRPDINSTRQLFEAVRSISKNAFQALLQYHPTLLKLGAAILWVNSEESFSELYRGHTYAAAYHVHFQLHRLKSAHPVTTEGDFFDRFLNAMELEGVSLHIVTITNSAFFCQTDPKLVHSSAQCVLCQVRCHCIFSGPGIRYSDIFCVPCIR